MKKNTWLEKATAKKAHREELTVIHGNIGADGIRLHYDPTQPAEDSDFSSRVLDVILPPARKNNQTEFSLTKAALVTACKQAMAIGRGPRPCDDYTPALHVSVNGSFQYKATCEANGSISGEWLNMEFESYRKNDYPVVSSYRLGKGQTKYNTCRVTYSHTGRDVEFSINPRFLLDALSGMESESVTVRTAARNAPIYLTDGTREAIVMPFCS
jgi:hypothetical protein